MAKKTDIQTEQMELENMPPASPIGRAARALMAVRDEIAEMDEQMDKKHKAAKIKLLDLMTQEAKEAICVDGVTFRKVHVDASDEIRVIPKKVRKQKKDEE